MVRPSITGCSRREGSAQATQFDQQCALTESRRGCSCNLKVLEHLQPLIEATDAPWSTVRLVGCWVIDIEHA